MSAVIAAVTERADSRSLRHGTVTAFALFALVLGRGCDEGPSASIDPAREVADRSQARTQGKPAAGIASTGKELYQRHCEACHGEKGAGDGIAARYLHPRPLDLRTAAYHLASTANGVASADDIESILLRDLPGSSMPSFDHLPDAERKKLAQEVLRLRREGMRQRIIRYLREQVEDEEIDEGEVEAQLDWLLAPGSSVVVPTIGPADAATIARGKAIFRRQGCIGCHGLEGKGDADIDLTDEHGEPLRPRNLVQDHFKGGREPESIYLRVLLGMPGSPMPASTSLPQEQRIDLVQYVRSLSREPKQQLTNYQRARQALVFDYKR
ncbi:MAG: cytochrome c [Pirellulaceae bacterium]